MLFFNISDHNQQAEKMFFNLSFISSIYNLQSSCNLLFLLLLFTLFSLSRSTMAASYPVDPDEKADFATLVRNAGFQLEAYHATTEDGYILTIHRIVPKGHSVAHDVAYTKARKPVLIFHGLSSSADNFFLTSHGWSGRNASSKCGDNIAYCLVESGHYDVWLGNNRGNGYSMKHTKLNTSQAEFWHFSMDQISKYDLPTTIDLVLNKTGHKQIGYIGHSQGCAIMFGLLSEHPEKYSEIIQPFIAWAPGVYIHNVKSNSFRVIESFSSYYLNLGNELNLMDVLGKNFDCHVSPDDKDNQCLYFLYDFAGPTTHNNLTRLPVYLRFFPAPTSMWSYVHYGQIQVKDRFVKFDYGSAEKNRAVYGVDHPPEYQLTKINPKTKVVIMWGETDNLIAPKDIEHLHSVLKPVLKDSLINYRVPSKEFNHFDFAIAQDAGPLVYDKTLEYLNEFTVKNH